MGVIAMEGTVMTEVMEVMKEAIIVTKVAAMSHMAMEDTATVAMATTSLAPKDCSHEAHKATKKPMHIHDYRVSSVGFTKGAQMKSGKQDQFIQWLMQEKGPDLYRSKGVLAIEGVKE